VVGSKECEVSVMMFRKGGAEMAGKILFSFWAGGCKGRWRRAGRAKRRIMNRKTSNTARARYWSSLESGSGVVNVAADNK
jgi:hypothetical protein